LSGTINRCNDEATYKGGRGDHAHLMEAEGMYHQGCDERTEAGKNTLHNFSTVVRVLEKKGFVGHKAIGTTYLYRPLLEKKDYLVGHLSGIAANYFNGSLPRMAAFFAKENDLNLSELQELMGEIKSELNENDSHE